MQAFKTMAFGCLISFRARRIVGSCYKNLFSYVEDRGTMIGRKAVFMGWIFYVCCMSIAYKYFIP